MAFTNHSQAIPRVIFIAFVLFFLATPAEAFGAGYVSRGSHLKAINFRHGDIALAVPLFATANRRLVKQIYFGNWLRDFSQLLDRSSLSLVPRPILRALVAVFAFVQFGYATREFEVTNDRLGFYRPEEHVDNPRGYDNGSPAPSSRPQASAGEGGAGYQISEGLRPAVHPTELAIDPQTGMKNYIANSSEVGAINPTSADYVEKQLIAAIACGRQGDEEAYIHLGAALHTLEDFVAHSNYVELAMRLIGSDIQDRSNITPALGKIFTYVGGGVKVTTSRGEAPPIITGTFGALDLYQTLLGEIDDKLNAMSLPGLKTRTSEKGGALQGVVKSLLGVLNGVNPGFEKDILKIQKAAADPQPASWGALEQKPEKLWELLEPVFKLRDDVVKWVYDHLTVRAVQDALAAISAAIDKLVYMVLGIVLGPLLSEFSKVLKDQEQLLLKEDQAARLAAGEHSIFDDESTASDPTHSQLAKDHYDNTLNEIAGRVAVRISGYTTTAVIHLWQPGNTQDPRPSIQGILEAFHHPFNRSTDSAIQTLMLDEVSAYVQNSLESNTDAFESDLRSLTAEAVASRNHGHADLSGKGSHSEDQAAAPAPDSTTAQTKLEPTAPPLTEEPHDFTKRVSENIERQLKEGKVKGIGITDLPMIKDLLFAAPSGESPNPLDSGLAKIPGISFLSTFDSIGISEIAAADGMGETLKDAVITTLLLDETRGAKEEDVAAGRFGWGKSEKEKEERARLKDLRALLKIKKIDTTQEEGRSEGKKSMGDKLKDGFGKLKLKASTGSEE